MNAHVPTHMHVVLLESKKQTTLVWSTSITENLSGVIVPVSCVELYIDSCVTSCVFFAMKLGLETRTSCLGFLTERVVVCDPPVIIMIKTMEAGV